MKRVEPVVVGSFVGSIALSLAWFLGPIPQALAVSTAVSYVVMWSALGLVAARLGRPGVRKQDE